MIFCAANVSTRQRPAKVVFLGCLNRPLCPEASHATYKTLLQISVDIGYKKDQLSKFQVKLIFRTEIIQIKIEALGASPSQPSPLTEDLN